MTLSSPVTVERAVTVWPDPSIATTSSCTLTSRRNRSNSCSGVWRVRSSSFSIRPPTKVRQAAVGERDVTGSLDHDYFRSNIKSAKAGSSGHAAGYAPDDDDAFGWLGHLPRDLRTRGAAQRENQGLRLARVVAVGVFSERHWHRVLTGTSPRTCSM